MKILFTPGENNYSFTNEPPERFSKWLSDCQIYQFTWLLVLDHVCAVLLYIFRHMLMCLILSILIKLIAHRLNEVQMSLWNQI